MKFKQFLEGVPANWKPTPAQGGTPLASALQKIKTNVGEMPFTNNFMDSRVIQTRFGLTDMELKELQNNGLIVRDKMGQRIDKNKFMQALSNLTPKHIAPPVPGTSSYASDYKDWQATGGKMTQAPRKI